eukprot:CAMPEP_0202730832 /NCGR_PEP_ID=MMETSP1385-20130828/186841_1 /ASSEMBLY_ACC=CAM_ASM_000861 /TAXON_ID=933848 /ORGANISM="Elphidium margaritaceum" /LENGTH=121 /DNA_ID=CAMNT_0049397111 /DNA_START=15 /DNA_END=380 /DNA_ORIENTATION=+
MDRWVKRSSPKTKRTLSSYVPKLTIGEFNSLSIGLSVSARIKRAEESISFTFSLNEKALKRVQQQDKKDAKNHHKGYPTAKKHCVNTIRSAWGDNSLKVGNNKDFHRDKHDKNGFTQERSV